MNEPPDEWEETVRQLARRFPYPSTPNLAARVRIPRPARRRPSRLQWALLLIVALLLFSALSVPAVRAGLADFFQIGSVRIWRTSPKFPVTLPVSEAPLGESVTLEAAQTQVWYPIALPTYPESIGAPDEVLLLSAEEDGIQLIWHATPTVPELKLTQFGAGFWVNKWGPVLEEVTPSTFVNNRYAVWAPGPHTWRFMNGITERLVAVPAGSNVLIWSAGDITYRLESTLSQEEAIQLAESLR